jgi:hypothetical protein
MSFLFVELSLLILVAKNPASGMRLREATKSGIR